MVYIQQLFQLLNNVQKNICFYQYFENYVFSLELSRHKSLPGEEITCCFKKKNIVFVVLNSIEDPLFICGG